MAQKKNKKSKKKESSSSEEAETFPDVPKENPIAQGPTGGAKKMGSTKEMKEYLNKKLTAHSQDKLISMNRLLSKQQ
jgi:hypothetical protein